MKLCDSRLNILLVTSFASQQINSIYSIATELEIYVIPFSCHSTFIFIAQV